MQGFDKDRAIVLLKAVRELLNKQMQSSYVLNLLSETVFYDEEECEGNCLYEDIGYLLEDAGELKEQHVILQRRTSISQMDY